MNSHKNIKISDFTYDLPNQQIAKYPLAERDKSKLLIWKNNKIKQDIFVNCAQYIPENSLLVFNNTRVIHARLFFKKETGAKIEIFCLEPVKPADYQLAFQSTNKVIWKCMVGNAKKWKSGILSGVIHIDNKEVIIEVEKKQQVENTFMVEFRWNKTVTFSEIINTAGELPIPPYLNRKTERSDEKSYQTVYAKLEGSVAAPTAGLHFTKEVISQFSDKNIGVNEITLHVGAGTFQPVKSETIAGHTMHHEKVIIPKQIIKSLIENLQSIVAVGTTSVRSLESLYWLGLQIDNDAFDVINPEVTQWEPYQNKTSISVHKALQNILDFLNRNSLEEIQFSTQIIILPGYDFKLIRGMFTNFHQPQSTLLLLVAAFLGENWKKVYEYALSNNFRFLSYGDSNLYLR